MTPLGNVAFHIWDMLKIPLRVGGNSSQKPALITFTLVR